MTHLPTNHLCGVTFNQIALCLHILTNHHFIGSGAPDYSSTEVIPAGDDRMCVPCHLGGLVDLIEMVALLLLLLEVCELSHELPRLVIRLEIGMHTLSFLDSFYDVLVIFD